VQEVEEQPAPATEATTPAIQSSIAQQSDEEMIFASDSDATRDE
jgi:hypothetical protein